MRKERSMKDSFFIRDRVFYRTFFTMAAILMLQKVVTISVDLLDNMMLGAYSENALAGAAVVNQIQFVFQQILFALGEGIIVLGGQYFGKKNMRSVKRISACAMRCGLIAAVVFFLMTSIMPDTMIRFFTSDSAIRAEGVRYLSIIRYTYLCVAVTQILLSILRSVGIVNIALILSLLSLGINCIMNYILIYGRFEAPEMGIVGAAIGTLTARLTEMFICIFVFVHRNKVLTMRPGDFLIRDHQLMVDYFHVTAPIFVVQLLWGFNNAVQNSILGHMDSSAIAANSVASTLFLMVKSMASGTASAAAFITAKTVGEGKKDLAQKYANTMQVLFLGVGLLSGFILFLIKNPVLSLYQLEDETRLMAGSFLNVLCITLITMSYQMPVNTGIIKGGGDTKYSMILDLISIWGIVIPLSYIMAFAAKASPVCVIWCLNSDQIFKCVPAYIKVNHRQWIKKLTND